MPLPLGQLQASDIQTAANQLHQAEQNSEQIRSLSYTYPQMTIADSYAIQQAWVELKVQQGQRIIGRKIGLTSKAMQNAMQIDEPDYGTLLEHMRIEDGADIACNQFTDPRIEVELAFVMAQPLAGPHVTLTDVLNATDYVVPALELIAARTFRVDPETGKTRGVVDTIADNAANAGIVLGGRPIRPMDVDLRWVGALLYRNGVLEETGVAAGVLNHPGNGIVWLARKLDEHGASINAGDVVLAGSFTRPITVSANDTFHADYGQLGSISVHFH